MGENRNAYNILVREPEGKGRAEYLSVDGKIILEWIVGKFCRLDLSDSG
jgi:hypothetical protein